MEARDNPLEAIKLVEQDNLEVAERMALEKLAAQDPRAQARRCGAELVEDDTGAHLRLVYLGTPLQVTLPDHRVLLPDATELNPYERVLVLHYLTGEGPVPPESEPITFRQVPSGAFYAAAFDRRAKKPLLSVFGNDPEAAMEAARGLGGTRVTGGDAAVRIPAFPRVDLTLVFHRADEEFPADTTLLLSSSITAFLSTEDIATLAGMTAYKLMKGVRK
jgi:hypothetical protein